MIVILGFRFGGGRMHAERESTVAGVLAVAHHPQEFALVQASFLPLLIDRRGRFSPFLMI